jgi:DNA-binding HxlR family transcriptional regulator
LGTMGKHTKDMTKSKTAAKPEETLDLRGNAHPLDCTRAALRITTGKWKGEILWNLKDGTHRFGELMRAIPGITQHMLTAQLRSLERHGLVKRTVYAEVPPRVEYELTPAAHDLRPVFEEINRWANRHGETLRLGDVDNKNEPL